MTSLDLWVAKWTDLGIREVALLLVGVGEELVLHAELEVLEEVAVLEELVAPLGGRHELGLVEDGDHAQDAEQREEGEEGEAEADEELGQVLADGAVVEEGELVHEAVEGALPAVHAARPQLAAPQVHVLLEGDDEGEDHGDDHDELDQDAGAWVEREKRILWSIFIFSFFYMGNHFSSELEKEKRI